MKPYIPNRSTPIDWESLNNPENPLVILIMYIYTLETFIYYEINKGLRTKDTSKARTLGPFSKVLGYILAFDANRKRKDIVPYGKMNQVNLFRGTCLEEW
jgi:hypothetical protein